MRRRVIIASHSMLSKGMAETLKFFEGEDAEFVVITAYVDNKPIEGIKNSCLALQDRILTF